MSREVPAGWRRVRLGDVANESRARNLALTIPPEHLVGVFKDEGMLPMRERVRGTSLERCKVVRPGAFAYNPMRINIGSIARSPSCDTLMVSPDYVVFEPDDTRIDGAFLDLLRKSETWAAFVGHAGDGGVRIRIYFDHLAEFRFDLPPLDEQHRIAEILSSVDEAIAATRAVIEQTKTVKQAVLERLLTRGIGHTRFKQTEIGEIPEGWNVATLGSITVALEAGVSVNSESRPAGAGEYGILKTSCVSGGFFDPSENKTVIAAERARVRVHVKADRIVISRMNTPNLVGANGYVEHELEDIFLPDRLWQLKTSEHGRWLGAVLAAEGTRSRLREIATGTSGSMKNISKARLLELQFAIPPKGEQKQIAETVQELDTVDRANEQKLLSLVSAKSALMSELLTGRKRVTDALPMAAE